MVGLFIIYGLISVEWDIDNGFIMVVDWFYNILFVVFNCEVYDCGNEIFFKVDNIVVNGIGVFK